MFTIVITIYYYLIAIAIAIAIATVVVPQAPKVVSPTARSLFVYSESSCWPQRPRNRGSPVVKSSNLRAK